MHLKDTLNIRYLSVHSPRSGSLVDAFDDDDDAPSCVLGLCPVWLAGTRIFDYAPNHEAPEDCNYNRSPGNVVWA